MTVQRTGLSRRTASPRDAAFAPLFRKDFVLPDAAPLSEATASSFSNISSETDRLLKESKEQLARLRAMLSEQTESE